MGFRFWRRLRLAPGVTLNLSATGASLSVGPRGAKVTVGPRGRRATVGIPGTGLFYTTRIGDGRQRKNESAAPPPPGRAAPGSKGAPTLGFFKRLFLSAEEEALVDGAWALQEGDLAAARARLERATGLPDGAWLAGFLALRELRLEEAEKHLRAALDQHRSLGRLLARHGIDAAVSLPVTPEIAAVARPDLRGTLLGLVELYQHQRRFEDAIACLEKLRKLEPDDVVVKLSLAELLLDARPDDRNALRRVIRLAEGIENLSEVHAALLLYRARALRRLGLPHGALATLRAALRRRKGRSAELLRALRYERARAYEELGRADRARRDYENIYAEAPEYEDVAERLGL